MAMSVTEIRGWLLCQPRASMLRVVGADDRHHEVATNSGTWAAIAASIHALDPVLIEAYDNAGKILRAVKPQDDESAAATGEHPPAAPLVLPVGTDPQTVMLLHVADLIAAAYRHSTDVAFERLASLFESANRRSESLERSLDAMTRLLRRAHQDLLESAEPTKEEGGLLEEVVKSFAAGAVAHEGATPTNGKAG